MAVYKIDGQSAQNLYKVNSDQLSTAYSKSGDVVFGGQPVIDYDDYTMESLYTLSALSSHTQGFDIYGGVICAFRADNLMYLFNYSDGTTIKSGIVTKSEHGDSASFSNDFYDASDEFPLIYVTSDKTPAEIYVNRITRSDSTLIRTLVFPVDKAGYYAAAVLDNDINILYLLGYSEQSYTSDNGGTNKTVVSKWNLQNLTDNGDGTYTPEFIYAYNRPFIYVMQGLTYHDGMIWIASGYGSPSPSHVYAMNPITGVILHDITLPNTVEIEGVSFVGDGLIVLQWGGVFTKYTFSVI